MNTPAPKNSGLGIAAMVTALCGVSLLGVIFGHVSLSQIKKGDGQLTGRGMALTGVIVGYVGMVMWTVWLVTVMVAIDSAVNSIQ
ncbi:DUF4190 domain-containing protein [Candidatus Poriferisodalis sp.]|uniref:DUF4190 domain-containing protein n=1 Tax=Candidatus Poriferisodalis sp. TaxID=3101277 RepID=UPI003B02BC86